MKFVRENLMTLLILLGIAVFAILTFLEDQRSDYLVCGLISMGGILIIILVMKLINYTSRTEDMDDVQV